MTRTLIRGGCVVSMDPAIGTVEQADVLIADGTIQQIAPRADADGAEIIDASGCIVIPGLVDTHRHLWQTILRGSLSSCTLAQYFGAVMAGAGPLMEPEDVYSSTLLGCCEPINSGITTVLDWANVTNTPAHGPAAPHSFDGLVIARRTDLTKTEIRNIYQNAMREAGA